MYKLREALEWYSTMVSNCRKITTEGDFARHELDKDGGKRAKAALAAQQQDMGWLDISDVADGTPVVCFPKGYDKPYPFAGLVDRWGPSICVVDPVKGRMVGNITKVLIVPAPLP